jgi:hypothetical protein
MDQIGKMCRDIDSGGTKVSKLARFDLIAPESLMALAEHYGKNCVEHGGKYPARNWELGYSWGLSFAAMMRHAWQWWGARMGFPGFTEIDEETGSSHMTAVAWHAFTLFAYFERKVGKDDRPERSTPEAVPLSTEQAEAGNTVKPPEPPTFSMVPDGVSRLLDRIGGR